MRVDNEIDIMIFIKLLFKRKLFLITFTSIFAFSSLVYSLSLPNIYTSKAILSPVNQEDSLSSKLSSLSSLASLSGVRLPDTSSSKTQESIERIKSFDFFSKYFLPNVLLQDIMYADNWNPQNRTISYNKKYFDANSNSWPDGKPSVQQAYLKYMKALSIVESKDTPFITIYMKHNSPDIAKKWIDIVIYNINESMREDDRKNAENAINYLNNIGDSIKIQSLKEVRSSLLESQMQILMLAASNNAYVFKILEAPISPEIK